MMKIFQKYWNLPVAERLIWYYFLEAVVAPWKLGTTGKQKAHGLIPLELLMVLLSPSILNWMWYSLANPGTLTWKKLASIEE